MNETRERGLGHQLATALDDAWGAIRARHPDVPEVVLFASPVAHGKNTEKFQVLGHFGRDRWAGPNGPGEKGLGEVLVVAEHLARGGADVMETLIHEAAHAMCDARGVEDTSQEGRYHNRNFKAAAEELGLTVTQQGGRGFAATALADGTADAFADAIASLDTVVIAAKAARQREEKVKRQGPVKATCKCEVPRIIRVSLSTLIAGGITCHLCDTNFRVDIAGEEGDLSEV